MLDITPLDLDEVELYALQTHRVPLVNLDSSLQYALQDVIEDVIGAGNSVINFSQDRKCNFELVKKDVQEAIDKFNRYRIQDYNRGNICIAEAGALVQRHSGTDYIVYEAWVDYKGITQSECDKFPPYLLQEIYGKYLAGFTAVRTRIESDVNTAKREIEACIMDSFQQFKGQRICESMMEAFQTTIKQNVIATGLVDTVELDLSEPTVIQIKSTIHAKKGPIILNSRLQIN